MADCADCPTCRRDGYHGGLDSDENAWLAGCAMGLLVGGPLWTARPLIVNMWTAWTSDLRGCGAGGVD